MRRAGHTTFLFLALISALLLVAPMWAGGNQEESSDRSGGEGPDADYVGIAAVMLRDGNLSRAEDALSNVDEDDPDLDRGRYFTLRGLLALRSGDADAAITEFQSAIENGQEDPSINAYLAQAFYLAERYEETIDAIERLPSLRDFPSLYSVRAAAQWNLDQWEAAFQTLERAELLFPDREDFARQQVVYLLELGLSREAARRSVQFLESAPPEPDSYLTIGQALREGGERESAIQVLEEARL
ncbi:MAG: tetratricopeptide repeat protein [Alkalispirochaeta sp.]